MRRICLFIFYCATLGATQAWAQQSATTGPARGALMLVGGGANRPAFIQKFAQLAGGPDATIVVIPTTLDDDRLTPEGLECLRTRSAEIFGVNHIIMLHTRDRRQADSPTFVEPLRHASGVWILGGEDTYFLQAYLGTQTEKEIKAVVARGGVLGGTSAGAMIQGSILIDGKILPSAESPGPRTVRVDGSRPAFGLLTNSLVVPHWSQRKIEELLPQALATQPGVLGIGIDEATAAVIQGNRLEVLGDGHVGIYDGKDHDGKSYYLLSSGQRFDLKKRSLLPLS